MDKSNNEVENNKQNEAQDSSNISKEEVKDKIIKKTNNTEEKNCRSKFKRKMKILRNKKICIRGMSFIVMSLFLFGATMSRAGAISVDDNKISLNLSHDNQYVEDNNGSSDKDKNEEQPKSKIKVTDKEDKAEAAKEEKDKHDTKYKNTSEEGQKYIYDAVDVSKKLKNEDYKNGGKKIVFLTFDDGASNTVTPKILKTLDDYNVKATFFIMGQVLEEGGENAKKLVKEEYDKGHAIGNHSYCHDYNVLYPERYLDLEAFKNDYNKNTEELKKILGEDFSTRVIRCPGGYMSWKGMEELDGYLQENNMASIDWSALSGDAEGGKKDASQLLKYSVESSMDQEMVVLLMHDTYGKEETAKSLPKIIEYFKGHGYEFRTLG